MAISRVGFTSALSDSIAIPSHQAGDIIVISVGRNNTTPATIPSGWITQVSTGSSGVSNAIVWKMAKSSSETSGTFTNASVLQCAVYRGDAGVLAISAAASGQAGNSTSIQYPALANGLAYRAGFIDNWHIGVAFQLNSANSLETAPTNMANVMVDSSSGVWKAAFHDGQLLSSWTASTVTVTTSAQYVARVIQLFEFDGPAFGGGGGGGIFFRPGMSGGMSE
jgi:hypothetical protein